MKPSLMLGCAAALLATAHAALQQSHLAGRATHVERLRQEILAAHGANPLPPDQFFNQTLDHYDVLNNGWWQQRFWVNETFWDGSGPVFFYVEGEGAGSPTSVVGGQHVELAAGFGALVVSLEHRFYGASIPTPDLSTSNMRYLSSHQAVGDVARFIREYLVPKYNLSLAGAANPNRIVTFGGSYPGALSAWLRLRLPHLVHTALSTSSPVQAVADFTGYNDVVAAALSNPAVGGSNQCLSNVQAAFAQIDAAMVNGSPAQRSAMSLKLASCSPCTTDLDAANFASNIAGQIMGVVQYNMDHPNQYTVQQMCATMTDPTMQPLDALVQVVLATLAPQTCMDNTYSGFLAQLTNTTADRSANGVGLRQWTWQTCTQFGYYQTCEAGTSCPFSALMTLPFSFQICQDGFGINAATNVDRINFTNDVLGGYQVQADRIIFTNGGVDPWHYLSNTPQTLTDGANVALWIPTGAHCRNMYPSLPTDPADVRAARTAALDTLKQWLTQPY